MLPIGATRKPQNTPYITYGLIAINVLVFLWQTTLSGGALTRLYFEAAFVPCHANLLTPETYLSGFRSMFLHGGWLHLVSNMMFLGIFGPLVEDYFGKRRFLLFYLVAGYAASFTHLAFNSSVCIPVIGASGAIYGVMGAFLLLYPATRINSVAFFLRIPIGTVKVQAFYMLLYYFIIDFINGLGALGAESVNTTGVAFWAHIGGFVIGLLLTFTMILFKPAPNTDPFEYMDG